MQAVRLSDEEVRAIRFWVEAGKVHVEVEDGREAAVPVAWYPRLAGASEGDLQAFNVMGGNRLIHWPKLEEALGVATILGGVPGSQPPPGALAPRAKRIKAFRLKANLTQVELALKLGCSQALVSMAEKGKAWVGAEWEERVLQACGEMKEQQPKTRKDRAGRNDAPKVLSKASAGRRRGKELG